MWILSLRKHRMQMIFEKKLRLQKAIISTLSSRRKVRVSIRSSVTKSVGTKTGRTVVRDWNINPEDFRHLNQTNNNKKAKVYNVPLSFIAETKVTSQFLLCFNFLFRQNISKKHQRQLLKQRKPKLSHGIQIVWLIKSIESYSQGNKNSARIRTKILICILVTKKRCRLFLY